MDSWLEDNSPMRQQMPQPKEQLAVEYDQIVSDLAAEGKIPVNYARELTSLSEKFDNPLGDGAMLSRASNLEHIKNSHAQLNDENFHKDGSYNLPQGNSAPIPESKTSPEGNQAGGAGSTSSNQERSFSPGSVKNFV